MDCKTARLLFDFARPQAGELDAAELAAFEQHLAGCPECDALARAERGVEFAFAKAMRAVEAPAGLRNRLMERLDRERGDVYLRWFGNAGRVAAAAAVVLLVVGGIYYWNQTHLPAVDMDGAWEQAMNRHIATPDLAGYFRQRGYDGPIPRNVNYSALAYYGMGEFQGRPVPRMIFIAPKDTPQAGAHAEVLLLSRKQFNLADAPTAYLSPPGYAFQLALWRDSKTGATEVVDYTAGPANWLRAEEDLDRDAQ
jgi:hypothetical protein